MDSIWKKTSSTYPCEKLKRDIKTDVLIIGGGITGILCAYMLKNVGVDCVIVEAERIGSKTTGNTTAKITLQHGLIYSDLIKMFGEEKAKLYLEAQKEALTSYEALCKNIDCDYRKTSAIVYSTNNGRSIAKELEAYSRLKYDVLFTEKPDIPVKCVGAIEMTNQAVFHPLKFIEHLSKGLIIYENTPVYELRPGHAKANGFDIKYEKAIIATHFPFIDNHGFFFLKMFQHRSYVIALRGAQHPSKMYVDESKRGMSFRDYNGYLLLGGGGHRTGKNGGGWSELESFAKKHYNGAEVISRWATQDCVTVDGIPYIGQYSKNTPYLYVATGFNKWGMTNAMVSGFLLRDIIMGNRSEYCDVFSPSRTIMRPQLVINTAETLMNFIKPTIPRCTHLGCALKYNKAERSWDCPCHGSRFDKSGKLLNNPANTDLGMRRNHGFRK